MHDLRLYGHPLHPALVHFPIAFWMASLAAEVAVLVTGAECWRLAAWWLLVAGLAMAVPTITAGFVEYSLLSSEHRAFSTAGAHMLTMSFSALCFLASSLVRSGPDFAAGPAALACSSLGFLALLPGGWLGGSLVYRFGVGVEPKD